MSICMARGGSSNFQRMSTRTVISKYLLRTRLDRKELTGSHCPVFVTTHTLVKLCGTALAVAGLLHRVLYIYRRTSDPRANVLIPGAKLSLPLLGKEGRICHLASRARDGTCQCERARCVSVWVLYMYACTQTHTHQQAGVVEVVCEDEAKKSVRLRYHR